METELERRARMRELGRKGGLATKKNMPQGHYRQIGRIGGTESAKKSAADEAAVAAKKAQAKTAAKASVARRRRLMAAGKLVLEGGV
jgi:general stress protein YciG